MKEIERNCHCEVCGKDFISTRPFSDVIDEAADLFPGLDPHDAQEMSCLCEECFIKLSELAGRTDFIKYITKH